MRGHRESWVLLPPVSIIAILAGCFLSVPTMAACFRDAYGRSEFQIRGPVRLAPRGIAVGAALSPWLDTDRIYSPVSDLVCDSASDNVEFGVEGQAGAVGSYSEAGIPYSVYSTGAAGVGIVIRARPISHAGRSGGFESGSLQSLLVGTGITGNLLTVVQVKFVRLAGSLSGGQLMRFQIGRFYARYSGTRFAYKPAFLEQASLAIQDEPACYVNSQSVYMGEISVGRFKGLGSSLPPVPYTVTLNCDASVGRVDYQISSVTPVMDEAEGIAEVSGGALGVGIQFLDDKSAPMSFYRTHTFGDARLGETSRMFQARYRQTGGHVEPGEANAMLTFVFTYP
ncbi:fimbrial protein [Stenotrophomonas maltophilia]|nr:fimbrial protein [Stenotrophomonas sp. SMYL41]MCU0999509.1 fimbrial protein [Stenotrophomonas maltophilia]